MAESKTEIANMALANLGVLKKIADLETDSNERAVALRTFYDESLEETLRKHHWPFAKRYVSLALIEEDPNDDWAFSYRYPSSCVEIRKILTGTRAEQRDFRKPWQLGSDDSGLIVFTDEEEAVVWYTHFIEDPLLYPSDFTISFSYKLASLISPAITGGDRFNLKKKMEGLFDFYTAEAYKNSAREEQVDREPESESITARN